MVGNETVEESPAPIVQRLCNEIQLFDLCDLNTCRYKDGRFCTNSELVAAFEKISDAETVRREVEISEEAEDGGDEESDDAYDDRDYDEEPEFDDE